MISVGVFLNSDGGSRRSLDDGLESNGVRIAKLDKAMNDLISYMMENCCLGNAEECAPAAACQPARERNVKPRLRHSETEKRARVNA